MSTYGISKFLFAFNTDAQVRSSFKADPESALSPFPLTVAERQAITSFDFRWLHQQGIHPLLLSALANGSGIPVPKLVEAIR